MKNVLQTAFLYYSDYKMIIEQSVKKEFFSLACAACPNKVLFIRICFMLQFYVDWVKKGAYETELLDIMIDPTVRNSSSVYSDIMKECNS